jgi:hypothetical protein
MLTVKNRQQENASFDAPPAGKTATSVMNNMLTANRMKKHIPAGCMADNALSVTPPPPISNRAHGALIQPHQYNVTQANSTACHKRSESFNFRSVRPLINSSRPLILPIVKRKTSVTKNQNLNRVRILHFLRFPECYSGMNFDTADLFILSM